jgi:quinol monooxygenase YgiN
MLDPEQLWVVAELTIQDGKLDDFKKLAQLFTDRVKKNEPGTLKYEWYLSSDETVCYVIECYRDSDAVMAHFEDTGDLLEPLTQLSAITRLECYGSPSRQVIDTVEPLGTKFFSHLLGVTKFED